MIFETMKYKLVVSPWIVLMPKGIHIYPSPDLYYLGRKIQDRARSNKNEKRKVIIVFGTASS